jgi:hypothetical protein
VVIPNPVGFMGLTCRRGIIRELGEAISWGNILILLRKTIFPIEALD